MSRALRIVFAGHVDHGKSTIIGRLLHETGNLPDGKVEELEAASRRRHVPMEWSFVLDALQAERDQAVTMDTTRVWFKWNGSRYSIIDAPGHVEFIRNMLSGAAEADAAFLVVDADTGVAEQTRRHAQLLHLLGVDQIAVAINKVDLVGYDRSVFDQLVRDCTQLLKSIGVAPLATIPVSGRDGENLVRRSPRLPWYEGPTLMETIETFRAPAGAEAGPLRMRVQDVYRSGNDRVAVGRIDSGRVAAGDPVVVSPLGSLATVRSIEVWPDSQRDHAGAGDSIGLTFNEPVFVGRGDTIAGRLDAPALDYGFHAICFWLAPSPPVVGEYLTVQFGPKLARAAISGVETAVHSSTLEPLPTDQIVQYAIVGVRLRSNALLPLDTRSQNSRTSRVVLLRGTEVVAGGFVSSLFASSQTKDLRPRQLVTSRERFERNGHKGAVVWLTGLSGAGKSTLAMELERRLFIAGASVFVLDGDAIRTGLNSDLGFSQADRAENIRRIGEVAALMADTGMIVVTALISPMQRDRDTARQAAKGAFHEVFVKADLATCEARDTKGLYKRARAGEIGEFTGISAPYEDPISPDLIIETETAGLEDCVNRLMSYVAKATDLRQLQASAL